jgi:hypothetical protein
MAVNLPTGFARTTNNPIDQLFLSNTLAPYATVAAANTAILVGIRYKGLFVNIDNGTGGSVLYWYKDGTTDGNLVAFSSGGGGTVTAVTATAPISSSGGATPNITITLASSVSNGYLQGSDWTTFNNKQNALSITNLTDVGTDGITITNGTGAVIGASPVTLSQQAASAITNGYLTKTDWAIFNGKGSGTITTVTGTTPISSSGGTTPDISISQANASTSGYLSNGDWTTFNNKGNGTITSVSANAPISSSGGTTPVISISQSSVSTSGYLSATDFTTFNNKQAALNITTLAAAGTDGISVTNGAGAVIGTVSVEIAQQQANGTNNGYLSSTDWAIFNGKGTGTVTSVSGTTPIVSSGGTTPSISIPQATGVISGYLSSGDWTTFTNKGNGTITSLGVSMPTAFSVANSPITTSGTIAITGAGVASQYVRGDGTLANFPTSTGGGSSVSYYLNGSVNQGTIIGNVYEQMSKTAIFGAGTDFNINTNGYIAQFITDIGDPDAIEIPSGNWNLEMYFSASSSGGTPNFYVELYKYDGAAFTLIATNSATPESITGGTAIDLYTTSLAVPLTSLTINDRLAIRVYVSNSGRIITLHTEDSHLCQIITTFSTGLTALNGLTDQVQYLAVGTTGSDFNILSSTNTHTFNLPTASASIRGALSSADWTMFNNKGSGTITNVTATTPISSTGGTTPNISISLASSVANGYLSSTDWSLFNNKQATLSLTNLTDVGLDGITITNGTSAVIGTSPVTIAQQVANASNNGYLSKTDWATFNAKGSGTVTSVAGNAPIASTGGSTPTITISQSNATTDGYLSSGDWTTFNNKGSGTITSVTGSSPISSSGGTTPNITIALASSVANGYLSSTDWATFNGKQNALSITNLTDVGTDGITITNGTGAVIGASPVTLSQQVANATNNGYLSSTDWATFNSKGTGTVTSVGGTSPIVSSGGTTPSISIPQATTSVSGYLTSTDWTTFNNKGSGTVTSVSGTTPIVSSGGATPSISIPQATGSANGYLSSGDWTTFNGKGSSNFSGVSSTAPVSTDNTNPNSPIISMAQSNATTNGYLSSGDWTTFNNKGSGTVTSVGGTTPIVSSGGATPTISIPLATTSVSGYLSATDWTNFNGKGVSNFVGVTSTSPVVTNNASPNNPVISMPQATASADGFLSSGDWTTFNNKGSGTVTSVSGTTPIVSSGGATPSISIPQATTSVNGYLSSGDWTTFNNKGTVTSIATGTGLTGGTITGSGTISFSTAAVGTWAATPSSANLASAMTDETGTGSLVFGTSPTITTSLTVNGQTISGYNTTPLQGSIQDGVTSILGDLKTWTTDYYQGDVLYSEVSAGTITFGQLCYRTNTGEWNLADATTNAAASYYMLGICLKTTNGTGQATSILTKGFVATTYATEFKVGEPQYMSITAGSMSKNAPTASGNIVRIIGNTFWTTVLQTNSKYILNFNPDNTWIELT